MSTVGRRTPGPSDTMKSKKSESFMDKLSGTLTRRKKTPAPGEGGEQQPQHPEQQPYYDENEADEIEYEGREALEAATIPRLAKDVRVEEGEVRRFLTRESHDDPRYKDLKRLLIYWLNEELAEERIVIRDLQEDLYDGQVIQRLIEKLQNIRIEVPEVSQSERGQKEKLEIIIATVDRILMVNHGQEKGWTDELIHQKDIVAIIKLLVALVINFRAPIRLPEYVSVKMIVASKQQGHTRTEYINEQLTTTQEELGPKGERDAFDTLFDYGPDKLSHVKSSLLAFCNKHLNKINLEVNNLDNQFQDGVFLVLLMGLLEGYFVPLHSFHLQAATYEEKIKNVQFAYKLMAEAGLPKPRSRVQDIANGDLKSTLRLLHLLFTKYKHV